jgi:hypothetical protein
VSNADGCRRPGGRGKNVDDAGDPIAPGVATAPSPSLIDRSLGTCTLEGKSAVWIPQHVAVDREAAYFQSFRLDLSDLGSPPAIAQCNQRLTAQASA